MPFNPPPTHEVQAEQQSDPLEALKLANAKESYDWLSANSPDHFEAVQQAISCGVTPDAIYRFMVRDTFRHELAHRCRLAARWIQFSG